MAREAALKVQEAGAAWSEAYPALEYLHGPLAAADETTVVWLFGVDDDVLMNEIKRSGATIVATTGQDPQAALVTAQRVAVATALARGLDPDHPRYLTRSVVRTGR